MIEPTDLDWLALCLVTESNRPEEWPAIAQVIENRRRAPRWGDTYKTVVLARMQFSAFNLFTKAPPDQYLGTAMMFRVVAGKEDALLLMHAAAFCADVEARQDLWDVAISAKTLHYYSPVSMKPPGSKPPWAASAKRLYTPAGVDPERFVFAEGVP